MNPPKPRILETGPYAGRWISCVPTLALDDLLAEHLDLDDAELDAVASEMAFRRFLREKGIAEKTDGAL